jgi:hypothetical protein
MFTTIDPNKDISKNEASAREIATCGSSARSDSHRAVFCPNSVEVVGKINAIDFVFENCFLSAMTPYVDSRDGRSLSIYGSECQIWKTFTTMFTTIDPNKDISKMIVGNNKL